MTHQQNTCTSEQGGTVLEEKSRTFQGLSTKYFRPILAMFYQVILMMENVLLKIKQNMTDFYKGLQIT